MINADKLIHFRNDMEYELKENILKFWIDHTVDHENGGFYGYISDDLSIDKTHDRACVLYSRLLWTYSAAYRIYGEAQYLFIADRAYEYFLEHFYDKEYSGVYWMLDYKGNVVDPKKQMYAIAFAIYGFSEYFRATGKNESLDKAIELFHTLESYAYDKDNKGYIEALTREWTPLEDMSLSEKDMNVQKSMNTHLHMMEAYTNLLRVWDSPELKKSLEELINITVEHIISPETYQFKLFFDMHWNPMSDIISFGHDIEGSWLLYEAAEVLGNEGTLKKVRDISIKMAEKVYEKGIDRKYGGLYNEEEQGVLPGESKDWWPQAEAVVGFFNAFELTGKTYFMDEAMNIWHFISSHIIDKVYGEWFWSVSADGRKVYHDEKVGPWKCPYHNSRMCFEIMHRVDRIINNKEAF
jgi:cellobiose epimerase